MIKNILSPKEKALGLNLGKVLVIVPAFNEEFNIVKTIEDIRYQRLDVDILVVNDASKDQTSLKARTAKAITVDLPCNLGIGGAVQTGYIYAWEHNYDVALQFDGDGQHRGDELYKLLEPLENSEVDMVIGSRFLQKEGFKSTIIRRIGIFYFAKLISFIIRQKVTDTTSGFRAVNKRLIKLFVDYYPDDYPEPEVLIYLHQKDVKVIEVPVSMNKREFGVSSIQFFRSFYYVIKVTLSIFVNLIRF